MGVEPRLSTMAAAHPHLLDWLLLIPGSLAHCPACASWDRLPKKLLALESLSRGLPVERLDPQRGLRRFRRSLLLREAGRLTRTVPSEEPRAPRPGSHAQRVR